MLCVLQLVVMILTIFQTQLIKYNGYKAENFPVTTDDGFILNIQRIPQGRFDKQSGN
jgi:hypothetical protein